MENQVYVMNLTLDDPRKAFNECRMLKLSCKCSEICWIYEIMESAWLLAQECTKCKAVEVQRQEIIYLKSANFSKAMDTWMDLVVEDSQNDEK